MATGRRITVNDKIWMRLNNPGFVEMRKDPKLVSILRVRGETWVSRLNSELHAAQSARRQKVEDGYAFYVHTEGSRARLYVVATTARAQAHERKHSSILKLMETTRYDVQTRSALTAKATRKAAAKKGAETRKRRRFEAESQAIYDQVKSSD